MRLLVSADAPELHSLRWETLLLPGEESLLTTNENLPFSRYLSSTDSRPVRLRARGVLRALIVIANPANLESYNLQPLDVAGELNRAQSALGSIKPDVLMGTTTETYPTLENIFTHLRQKVYDLVYLVCHGRLEHGEPWLWLANAEGQSKPISGTELAERFKELESPNLPRLVILASCQSAGSGQSSSITPGEDGDGFRVAVGPRLVSAGVPAVIAMHGQISVQTIADCMQVFFVELLKDGLIDRAMAVARGRVRDRFDFWMPVLFMRLKDGLIWYEPSFRDEDGRKIEFGKWPTLTSSIQKSQCTAILGSGLVEPILGSHREIAQDWAGIYAYPLSPHERDSLPQVAQYLGIDQDRTFLLNELSNTLLRRIQTRFPEILARINPPPTASIDELVSVIGTELRRDNPLEPHAVLAAMPLKLYITTNVSSLMSDALLAAGRQPVVEILPWSDGLAEGYKDSSIFVREPGYRPSVERPLVYHLFGRMDQPDSIVLTEDDHFEFLKGATRNNALIPSFVQAAWSDSALLFLGYQLEDWSFRVLFRSILDLPGSGRLNRHSHIAVQIMPEVGQMISTDRALR